MFGLVPRALWEKKIQPDARHTIPQNAHVLPGGAGGWAARPGGHRLRVGGAVRRPGDRPERTGTGLAAAGKPESARGGPGRHRLRGVHPPALGSRRRRGRPRLLGPHPHLPAGPPLCPRPGMAGRHLRRSAALQILSARHRCRRCARPTCTWSRRTRRTCCPACACCAPPGIPAAIAPSWCTARAAPRPSERVPPGRRTTACCSRAMSARPSTTCAWCFQTSYDTFPLDTRAWKRTGCPARPERCCCCSNDPMLALRHDHARSVVETITI
jgi:hypothetical protein